MSVEPHVKGRHQVMDKISMLELQEITLSCKPTMLNFESRKDRIEHFSYQFVPGSTYAIVGGSGEGGWALSYLLSGKARGYRGNVMINGETVEKDLIKSYGWYVGEGLSNMTIRRQLELGTSTEFTANELIHSFELSPSRLEREMRYISNERWNASIAIGLMHEKQIFCFPWLNLMWKKTIWARLEHCSNILKQAGCICLIPVQDLSMMDTIIDDVVYLK